METRRSLVPELGKERGGRSYRQGSSVRQRGHILTLLPLACKPQPFPQYPGKTPRGMCLGGGAGGWIRPQIPQRAGARRFAVPLRVRCCCGADAEQQRAGCCPGPASPAGVAQQAAPAPAQPGSTSQTPQHAGLGAAAGWARGHLLSVVSRPKSHSHGAHSSSSSDLQLI